MAKIKYYLPKIAEGKFNCPHCGVYAKQYWGRLKADGSSASSYDYVLDGNKRLNSTLDIKWHISQCEHCEGYIFWEEESVIYPDKLSVEEPNDDLNSDIKNDYLEAAQILYRSPRGAAALLRLALQKLLKQLGESGENINDDIKSLIGKGLNPTIQKALDYVRVTGNNAVHPGQIDLKDNKQIAQKLFEILNFIAEKMLTEPKEVEELFDQLPEEEKKKIEKRDKK